MSVSYEIHVNSAETSGGVLGLIYRWAQNEARGSRCLPFVLRPGRAYPGAVQLQDRDRASVARSARASGTAEARELQPLLERQRLHLADLPPPVFATLAQTLREVQVYLERKVPAKDSLRIRVRVAAAQMQSLETLRQFPGCLLRRQDFMPLDLLVTRLEQRPADTFMHCFGGSSVSWLVEDAQSPPVQLHAQDPASRRAINSFAFCGQPLVVSLRLPPLHLLAHLQNQSLPMFLQDMESAPDFGAILCLMGRFLRDIACASGRAGPVVCVMHCSAATTSLLRAYRPREDLPASSWKGHLVWVSELTALGQQLSRTRHWETRDDSLNMFHAIWRQGSCHEVVSSSVDNSKFQLTPSLPVRKTRRTELFFVAAASYKLPIPPCFSQPGWTRGQGVCNDGAGRNEEEHFWATCQQATATGQIMSQSCLCLKFTPRHGRCCSSCTMVKGWQGICIVDFCIRRQCKRERET